MFGVILLTIILFYYAVLLLAAQIAKAVDGMIVESNVPHPRLRRFKRNVEKLQKENIRRSSGFFAFLFSLWNLFAPDFGAGGITVLGAFLPSLALFVDSLLLTPTLLDWVQLPENIKVHLIAFSERFSHSAGWITLSLAFLHIFFHPLPFI